MTKADAMKPIVALEATVVTGRTYQAYKRGKWDEAGIFRCGIFYSDWY